MAFTEMDQALKELVGMAKTGTARSRAVLAENVLDMFISSEGRLSDHERALTDDILTKLVREMEMQIRIGLAERLANAGSAPDSLLKLLANDEIAVAKPILVRSKLLHDADLIEIIRARGREHQLAISIRETVSPDVSDALIGRGEPDVIESLVRNPHAALSNQAMAHLVAESRRHDRFQEPLLSRGDLPPALAHKMFWYVSAALREKILTEYELTEHDLDQALEMSTKVAISDAALARQQSRQQTAAELAATMKTSGHLIIENMINMLRKQRIPAFTAAMSTLAGISFTAANRIILDDNIEPFAIMCKAIGISEAHFSSMAMILQKGRTRRPIAPMELRRILDLFNKVPSDQARITLRYWHNDSELLAAVANIRQ